MTCYSTDTAEVKALREQIKELKIELASALDGTQLVQGYEQALWDMQEVTLGVMELTRVQGPIAGLELLLKRLEEKEVPILLPPSPGIPHDWLSRWKVELA